MSNALYNTNHYLADEICKVADHVINIMKSCVVKRIMPIDA